MTPEWEVHIATPSTLKTFLHAVRENNSTPTFRVCKEDTFSGLRLNSIAVNHTVLVKACYECAVTLVERDVAHFTVDASVMSTLMHDVQASQVVVIAKYATEDALRLRFVNTGASDTWSESLLRLVEDEEYQEFPVLPLNFTYQVELSTEHLKAVCRVVKALHTSNIEFAMKKGEDNFNVFELRTRCDGATVSKMFHCTQSEDKEGFRVVTREAEEGVDVAQMEDVLCLRFSAAYISTIVKHMDRKTVMLYLGPESPLLLHYGLGGDQSYIDVIMAPISDE
jgi:hypothetical protein